MFHRFFSLIAIFKLDLKQLVQKNKYQCIGRGTKLHSTPQRTGLFYEPATGIRETGNFVVLFWNYGNIIEWSIEVIKLQKSVSRIESVVVTVIKKELEWEMNASPAKLDCKGKPLQHCNFTPCFCELVLSKTQQKTKKMLPSPIIEGSYNWKWPESKNRPKTRNGKLNKTRKTPWRVLVTLNRFCDTSSIHANISRNREKKQMGIHIRTVLLKGESKKVSGNKTR